MTHTENFSEYRKRRFDVIDLPTVVDIRDDHDDELTTFIYDASGQLVTSYDREHLVRFGYKRIKAMPEVANHVDQDLVSLVVSCQFIDGSSPLRLLKVPHRYVVARGRVSADTGTLKAVGRNFEIQFDTIR